MRPRTVTAVVGVLASLLVSVAVWQYFGTFVFFLFVPFVPFLFRSGERRPVRTCPSCGFTSSDPDVRFCPRDGTRLEADQSDDRPSAETSSSAESV